MYLSVRVKPAFGTIKKNSTWCVWSRMGISLACKDRDALKLRPIQRGVCSKDTQKCRRNPGQKIIVWSEGILGKWEIRLFFTVCKGLHELFHLTLSALALPLHSSLPLPSQPEQSVMSQPQVSCLSLHWDTSFVSLSSLSTQQEPDWLPLVRYLLLV